MTARAPAALRRGQSGPLLDLFEQPRGATAENGNMERATMPSVVYPLLGAFLAVTAGCKYAVPLYCDEETPCADRHPDRAFCDLHGEHPASEGIGRTCIPDPFPDAGLPDGGLDASPAPDAFVEPNLVFVTSSNHTGALGGLGGADFICNERAAEAGLPGTYVAWLSTATVHARERLAGARGWVRTDGLPFADTIDDLLAGRIFYPASRDENGNQAGAAAIWTGTRPNGMFDATNGDCSGWMSGLGHNTGMRGSAAGGFEMFTSDIAFGCQVSARLLCFGVDRAARLAPPSASGRLAFVTRGRRTGTVGVETFDALCAAEAAAADVAGIFLAAVSVGYNPQTGAAVTPPSGRMDLSGPPWVRPDGVKLFDSSNDITSSNRLLAPIQVPADGLDPVNDNVWTGAADFSGVNGNCTDWTEVEFNDAVVGRSALAGLAGASFVGSGCEPDATFPVYCFQQ
jgi:hypothetical protein